jgi:crossover junction endodeoxyribonuclease RusA
MTRLVLPYPISTNRYWRNFKGSTVKSTEARKYAAVVHAMALASGFSKPLDGNVKVVMHYHPKKPKNYKGDPVRSMDIDNVAKVAVDCLQGIAYHNDSQIVFLSIQKSDPVPEGALAVSWEAA